ncbi:ATP-dependent DNA ligase [Agromyces sp. NPDC049794]|uniref:DUF7882 family protein n=1 Tax=unclassified Agromyces TaxID=2639701 RepID=UPI00340F61FB
MGMLIYNGRMSLPVDDRTLAHLQAVVVNKLRRRESFAFTAMVDRSEVVSWIGTSTPLEFVYSGNRRPLLNRAWLELLAESASSNRGLVILPEPPELPELQEPTEQRDTVAVPGESVPVSV